MKLTFLGHSSFLLEQDATSILIDPFLTDNPVAAKTPDEVSATHILVTHGHDDHVGDSLAIAQRDGARVIATVETASLFPEDVETDVGQIGGWIPQDFGRVKFVAAAHGSGVAGGLACGYIVEIGDFRLYHAGDTGLISDMALLEYDSIDVALLPIGDRYTMGPEDALRAVKMIAPKRVIPMHYNTWPPLEQDAAAFAHRVEAETSSQITILEPGESLQL